MKILPPFAGGTGKPSWRQHPTLFIHIPKSGGTTLDAIFRDHYFDLPLLPSTPFDLFGHQIHALNDTSYRYIGGHYPISTIDASRFEERVTVLRDPLESLCSGISYINKLHGLPRDALIDAEKNGLPALTYKKFFTTHFDTDRYLVDLRHNVAQGMRHYLFECAASDAIANIRNFTHVLDFAYFDGEVKRFIMERGFFPYAQIAKKRQYAYQPDYERARRLLSDFDVQFFQMSKSLLKKVPDNIEIAYEQYREDYCKNHGLALRVHEGRSLDVRMPLGSGWHHVEQSDSGTFYRWSDAGKATLEIPIAWAGSYAVYIYINPAKVNNVAFLVSSVIGRRDAKTTVRQVGDMSICSFFVETQSHDWLTIDMQMDHGGDAMTQATGQDARERGVVLRHVYVCRHPC